MKYTLLMIDDDEDIRFILTSALSSIVGLTIVEAVDATSARNALQSQTINGILLDYSLPDTNGEELLREFKGSDSTQQLDIVMLTARDDQEQIKKWLDLGAKAVLKKPFNPFELIAQLQVHFGF